MRPYSYYALSHDPAVLCYLGVGSINTGLGVPWLPDDLRPVTLLEYPLSLPNEWHQMKRVARLQEKLEAQGIEHHFMVNANEEDEWRKECGVRGAQWSQNAFVNENVFASADAEKRYDAIHIAGMHDVKRHELAHRIRQLYVVTYDGEDLHAYRPELSHADFNRKYLAPAEVSELINASVSGLCLSASEGAMFASMEYLMCGLPVVTTPSRGGRDEFFDAVNSILVDPEPDAVLEGVQAWKRDPPDPALIRRRVLEQVKEIREGFCGYVGALINNKSSTRVSVETLMNRFYSVEGIAARALSIKRFKSSGDLLTFRFDLDSAIPRRIPGYKERSDRHSLHLESAAGTEMTTDSSGALVWSLCNGSNSASEITKLIADAYELDMDLVRAQINLTLRYLKLHGLIS